MNTEAEAFLQKQGQRIDAFRKALTQESDRGCALLATAFLDAALSDLLYIVVLADKKVEEDLFEGTAPLASFSSRIKMAYYLGHISASCRRELDLIRKIRNDFGHSPESISFDTAAIAQRCRTLEYSYHEKSAPPRSHFTAVALGLLGFIHAAAYTARASTPKPNDAPTEESKKMHRDMLANLADKFNKNRA